MRVWLIPLLALALLSPTATVLAGDKPANEVDRIKAAAEEFDAGRKAYTARQWEAAAEHFENASREAPTPEAVRLAMRARQRARDGLRAATIAEYALALYPEDKPTVALARMMIAGAGNRFHRLTVACTPACSLVVDRRLTPYPETQAAVVYLEPGTHEISAGWSNGRSERATVEAEKKGRSEISLQAPPEPEPEPKAPPPPPPKPVAPPAPKGLPRYVFWTGVGVTAAAGAVTTWSAVDMTGNPGKDKVRLDCAGKDESCPTYQDAMAVQRRTNVFIGVTAVSAAATTVVGLFFTDWQGSSADTTESAAAQPTWTPVLRAGDSWGIGAAGAF